MHKVIKLDNIRITYAGKAFGNMDYNYGSKKEVEKNHKKLIEIIESKYVADIRSKSGNTFVDLDTEKLEKHINFFACDGLITCNADIAFTLFPADCIPLVVYSLETNLKALLHVGRRGAEAGLIENAIGYISTTKHEKIENLRFYFGPSISKDSYYFEKVDSNQLQSAEWKQYIENKNGHYYIDLIGFTGHRLEQMGVKPKHIKYSEINVAHSESNYFSHVQSTRNGEPEGRNLSLIHI